MKVLFDHQIFTAQKYGGISRYIFELIKRLKIVENFDIEVPLLISNNNYFTKDHNSIFRFFFLDRKFKGKQKIMTVVNQLNTVNQLKKQNFDLFHPTYYDPFFLKYIGNTPFVLTVHDMIHEKFNHMFSSNDSTSRDKKALIEKASKIIAVSESTKRDLIEIYGLEESMIKVIYLGNSLVYDPNVVIDIDIPKKYLLFVGSRRSYKNFDKFVSATSEILLNDKELSLLCAGGGKFSADEMTFFANLNISNQVFQYDLSDFNLAYFYKHAKLFVFPSLYEGFGIPILEAFASECPLVCSNTSSLPEIAGNAAQYFDPNDENSIKNAVKNVLNDETLRTKLIQDGKERLKFFSWEKTAFQTAEVYKSIFQQKNI
ncbi:glycosyltransferase involved in cell wall biosynthesis [Flavobacterium nitrogenifigens]|uniref:Glycosyltransferase involved in cell wall biosynthesis n=2 Tax=Flavobacterium TaxID=237 RepID=A0A7W7IZX7_9FLAO|nr:MULTISPECIES: glycosyltransferase family 1 protein [Flavobacterium]MBB4803679.1 glycosyltransferase involved in cell wall biosynthesis [Flavobacterium nitrogenifigens]MBB6388516.1 glycosyltransferase involved in cell wall biosynthesis [Flavobacterium notoginsengisoli]